MVTTAHTSFIPMLIMLGIIVFTTIGFCVLIVAVAQFTMNRLSRREQKRIAKAESKQRYVGRLQ
jgi:F0F1-type ATP synthase assembly protein I